MKKRLLRLIGKGLAIIGTPVFLVFGYGTYSLLSYTGEYGPLAREVALVPLIALLGFSMIAAGVDLLQRFEEPALLLAKDGEPIHTGEIWKKGIEAGLFLTSCGRVVSVNQESSNTAHVGYKVVFEGQVICRDCATREGRVVLEFHAHGRKHY
ncbi:MAG: hypothetical protein ACFFFC_07680 [Candidatus Thorarchaeota archaeon]